MFHFLTAEANEVWMRERVSKFSLKPRKEKRMDLNRPPG